MEQYTAISYQLSQRLTERYSSSFSLSTRLFSAQIRPAIYAIYGMVRVADEIVDTYHGEDAAKLLDEFEQQVYHALVSEYHTNPILHAFGDAARRYGITRDLIEPFFTSMRMDLEPRVYDQTAYETYVYGSAEVIGLMCLKVFTRNDQTQYDALLPAARALGAAYQKVNFLRDSKADAEELKRWYFPNCTYATFDDEAKAQISADIDADFATARRGMADLPADARRAVRMSYTYYSQLHEKLRTASAAEIKRRRIRIGTPRKLWLLAWGMVR